MRTFICLFALILSVSAEAKDYADVRTAYRTFMGMAKSVMPVATAKKYREVDSLLGQLTTAQRFFKGEISAFEPRYPSVVISAGGFSEQRYFNSLERNRQAANEIAKKSIPENLLQIVRANRRLLEQWIPDQAFFRDLRREIFSFFDEVEGLIRLQRFSEARTLIESTLPKSEGSP